MDKQKIQTLRTRLALAGWTEMVEALDFALQHIPRDASVENGAEKEVRHALLGLVLHVDTVEWLHEDECFEVKFHQHVYRDLLTPTFIVEDVDDTWAWIKPAWVIEK